MERPPNNRQTMTFGWGDSNNKLPWNLIFAWWLLLAVSVEEKAISLSIALKKETRMCEEVQLYSTLAESWQSELNKKKRKVKSKHLKAYSVVVSNWHNHLQPNNSWLLNKQLHLIVAMSSYILWCNEKCGGYGLSF